MERQKTPRGLLSFGDFSEGGDGGKRHRNFHWGPHERRIKGSLPQPEGEFLDLCLIGQEVNPLELFLLGQVQPNPETVLFCGGLQFYQHVVEVAAALGVEDAIDTDQRKKFSSLDTEGARGSESFRRWLAESNVLRGLHTQQNQSTLRASLRRSGSSGLGSEE